MFDERRTHYEVLGVSRQAAADEIKTAFRKLAKIYHPDITPGLDGTRFRQICEAYRILSNPSHRRAYDRELHARDKQREDQPWYGMQLVYAQAR
ncbi:MAG: DnaJ domain-containing protein [Terriglobia bacterium]